MTQNPTFLTKLRATVSTETPEGWTHPPRVLLSPRTREAEGSRSSGTKPVLRIQPPSKGGLLNLRELWQYRELLYFLAWRDVKVRYKQTAIGLLWAVLQPLLLMLVFSLVLGRLAAIPSDGLPYPLFALCSLLAWQLFAQTLAASSTSLVANRSLLSKIYFPRLILPLSSSFVGLVDFLPTVVVLIAMMAWFGIFPTFKILLLPFLAGFTLLVSLGVGLFCSALYARYRDVRYVLPLLIQVWLFATPVAYSSSLIPEPWKRFLGLNPMAGVVESFRWALLGEAQNLEATLALAVPVSAILLLLGLWFFKRTETTLADII